MYTMEEDYSSGKEARNKCMSDCPDLHGARWLGLQRKMMELLLILPVLVPVRPTEQRREVPGNWSPQNGDEVHALEGVS